MLILLLSLPVTAQETLVVIRFVMTRQGGPVPIGETTAFQASDPKAIAWVQFQSPTQSHTVVFRWFAPQRQLQRVSPTRIVAPGEEFIWDELPIRDAPAADLQGPWIVELYADERLVSTVQFNILPPRAEALPAVTVQQQTMLSTKSQETRTGSGTYTRTLVNSLDHQVQFIRFVGGDRILLTSLSLGRLWGTSEGVRGAGLLSYSTEDFFLQGGLEGSKLTDSLQSPPLRTDTGAAFFDLSYGSAEGPTFSLGYRRETEVDDRAPHLTDSTTTSWTASSSYSWRNVSLSATYALEDVDDRSEDNFDSRTRTLALTAVYFPSPRLSLFVTRTNVIQYVGATPFSPAFSQTTNTTSARLTYQLQPNLSLALFTFHSDLFQSDALFRLSTSQRGAEATYQLHPRITLRALTQWQEQSSTVGASNQRLSRYGMDIFLPGGLTTGLMFSSQVTTSEADTTSVDIFTAYANFLPSTRFFFSGIYTLNRTRGTGETTNELFKMSLRYTPNPATEYQATAQFNDVQFPASPTSSTYTSQYQITAIFRF